MMIEQVFGGRRFRSPIDSRQSGFTLLETLLALSLLTMLMVTIVGCITLYAQYRHRGLEGARQAKVLLRTIDDLRNDLQACFDLGQATVTDSMGVENKFPSLLGTVGTSIAQEQFLSFSTSQAHPIRFVGRSNAILLLRQGTNARFEWTDFQPVASECQVLWLASKTQSIRLPSELEQGRPVEKEFRIPNDMNLAETGLHRHWMPVIDQQLARVTWTNTAKNTGKIAWDKNVEVQQIQFRYFDGHQWRSEWNSHLQENRLPLTVELEMTLKSTPQKTMRFVVRLPR